MTEQEREQALNKAMNPHSGRVGWVPGGSMGRWDGDHPLGRELWVECLSSVLTLGWGEVWFMF